MEEVPYLRISVAKIGARLYGHGVCTVRGRNGSCVVLQVGVTSLDLLSFWVTHLL